MVQVCSHQDGMIVKLPAGCHVLVRLPKYAARGLHGCCGIAHGSHLDG